MEHLSKDTPEMSIIIHLSNKDTPEMSIIIHLSKDTPEMSIIIHLSNKDTISFPKNSYLSTPEIRRPH